MSINRNSCLTKKNIILTKRAIHNYSNFSSDTFVDTKIYKKN